MTIVAGNSRFFNGIYTASLSTRKTPVSTSTVKRLLWDPGPLGRVAKKKPYLRLANKNKRLRWTKEHRHWTEELCLEGQHPRVASLLLMLLSCAPGPPTTLSILVRDSLCCSVKGVVHSAVPDLQFLGNFSHAIAFIYQNKNRLSFRRKTLFLAILSLLSNPQMLMLQILN